MKKLLATAFFALIGAGAFAQTTQGTIVVSGAVGFSKSTDKLQEQYSSFINTQNSTDFHVNPTVGYMLADGLEIGLTLGYNHTQSELHHNAYAGVRNATSNIYDMGSFIRKYFMLSDKVAFTGTAIVQYSKGKTKTNYPYEFIEYLKTTGFQAMLVPGITFFPTEKIGITASFGSFGYREYVSDFDGMYGKSESSNFGLNLDSSTLRLGLAYHFGK